MKKWVYFVTLMALFTLLVSVPACNIGGSNTTTTRQEAVRRGDISVTVNGSGSLLATRLAATRLHMPPSSRSMTRGGFDLGGKAYTVQTIQGASANAHVATVNSTLTVAPLSGGIYNGGWEFRILPGPSVAAGRFG
jgi:hypothetical protein